LPEFEGQIRTTGVGLGEGMGMLDYLVPVLAGTPDKRTGKLTMDLYFRGRGLSREALKESLTGQGDVRFESVDLSGSRFIAALSTLVDKPTTHHVGTIHSTIVIKEARILTDRLMLECGKDPAAELAGWTDFDGRVEYRPRVEGLNERLQSKGQELLARLRIDVKDVPNIRMTGTLGHLVLTVNGKVVDDKSRLRDVGQRLKERLVH
jgi:AsmA protein